MLPAHTKIHNSLLKVRNVCPLINSNKAGQENPEQGARRAAVVWIIADRCEKNNSSLRRAALTEQ